SARGAMAMQRGVKVATSGAWPCVPMSAMRRGMNHRRRTMMCNERLQRIARGLGLTVCAAVMACSVADAPEPPSWDDFQYQAARVVDGRTIYVVEWDLVFTLDELRDYYERNIAHPGVGITSQALAVKRLNALDYVWTNDAQLRLTYCVSDEFQFGGEKQR